MNLGHRSFTLLSVGKKMLIMKDTSATKGRESREERLLSKQSEASEIIVKEMQRKHR